MTLVKFNKNAKNALLPGFNDVFESIFNDTFFNDRIINRVPAVNLSESLEGYHIELAAPGLNKQDFKINVEENVLNIFVEQVTGNNIGDRKYNKREYSYNSFVRSFTMPEQADHDRIEAAYENGVLRVDIAKREEAKMVSRPIEIK
jgi:HSP20 family protein